MMALNGKAKYFYFGLLSFFCVVISFAAKPGISHVMLFPDNQSSKLNFTVAGLAFRVHFDRAALMLPPVISYQSPQVYNINTPVSPLIPSQAGGPVTGTGYGQVITVAGNGQVAGSANGTGIGASFTYPNSTVVDAAGNVYVADRGNNLIRKITPAGLVSTFAGSGTGHTDGVGTAASFSAPSGLAIDASGNIYVADYYNSLIRKISPAGEVSTFAGNGTAGYADGPASSASFNRPIALAADGSGNLYVTDQFYQSIRKITPAGMVSTFAGDSNAAGAADGTGAAARFYYPWGLATDVSENVYVADNYNNLIRKITPGGMVTTVAGSNSAGAQNGLGTSASFNNPTGITVDASGNLYVNDQNNNLIRRISTAGLVTTLAGNGIAATVDGNGAMASFLSPSSISAAIDGSLYTTENNVIRKISIGGYFIDKPLPAGLVFNSVTGEISGTPTVLSPATNYTVTAYNAAGSGSTVVNIEVTGQPPQTIPSPPVIPNTFTPNGDAINDTWEIKNINFYPDCTIRIFNRTGETIFTSTGYPLPWDGRYKNSTLPVGTYYYIIDLKNGQKIISGAVNLIK